LGILFALPRVILPRQNKSAEPHYSVKYNFGWEQQPFGESDRLQNPVILKETIDEDTLELEGWMFEPENWKINVGS